MLCPACGSEENGKFCGNCGTALADRIQIDTTPETPEKPSWVQNESPDEELAKEEDLEQDLGATDEPTAETEPIAEAEPTTADERNDQVAANSVTRAELSFWNIGTLIYMFAGVALLGYTCIYYWN